MKLKYLLAPLLLVLLFSCGSVGETYDYNFEVSVAPEEAGSKFTQLTSETDRVIGTSLQKEAYGGASQWNASRYISVSPDGKVLAFSARKNETEDDIYIVDTEGGRSVSQRTFNGSSYNPSFSFNGKSIAFSATMSGEKNIYSVKSRGGAAVQQLTNSTGSSGNWTPVYADSLTMYFCRFEKVRTSTGSYVNKGFIWGYDFSTSLFTQYCVGMTPEPIPNTNAILITRVDAKGMSQIWKVDLESGLETLLLSDPKKGFSSPTVSSDGKKIIVVGNTAESDVRPENLDLYQLDIDGGNLTQLTFHGSDDFSPKWAPDNKSIYFVSSRANNDGKFNIWKIEIKN